MFTPISVRFQMAFHRMFSPHHATTINYRGVKIVPDRPVQGQHVLWNHVQDVVKGLNHLPRKAFKLLRTGGGVVHLTPQGSTYDAIEGQSLLGAVVATTELTKAPLAVPDMPPDDGSAGPVDSLPPADQDAPPPDAPPAESPVEPEMELRP